MVTRKSLGLLAAATVVLFAISGIVGKNHHGAMRVVAFSAWWGFVLCVLALVGLSVATLVNHRKRVDRA